MLACLLSLVPAAYAQKDLSIAQVQGTSNISEHNGEDVRVSGIVTGRIRTGFFIQTPDDKQDADPKTSEAIFVFTRTPPVADAAVGNLVSVTGKVDEFKREADVLSLTITEIAMRKDEIRVISKNNPLPKPVRLVLNDFITNTVDELERFEGMRVQVDEMTVVGPTDGRVDSKTGSSKSDGTFFGVLKSVPRPFREPGMDIREYRLLPDLERVKRDMPKIPIFDSNPEIIRIDSEEQTAPGSVDLGQVGSGENKQDVRLNATFYAEPINVAVGSTIKDLVGVLHYAYGKYSIFPDATGKPVITPPLKQNVLPVPTDRQFVVAGMNLENFFDDQDDPSIKEDIVTPEAFQRRLNKISMAIRVFMQSPDVIGVVEAENLAALKRLAQKVNADSVAAGKPDPKYEAFVIDGNDGRGIDNGFLVKTSRVKVLETKQYGKDDKYKNPNTKEDNFLNDRPPLMLRASINDPKTNSPFEFTVIVNHLKSFLGYSDPKQQDNVRMKKRLQAEFLAKLVQQRQKADPKERIMLVGDFNAFQFNDGIVDQIGTIKGKPASKTEVLNPSDDLVDPDLIDLVDVIDKKQQYSYSFDGNAQVLDHIIVTETLRKHVRGFGYARVNADFPEVMRNDASRYERYSDHDPAVVYLTFDDLSVTNPK